MFTRKSIRLPDSSLYSSNYWYFVTILIQDRKCILVDIPNVSVTARTTSPQEESKLPLTKVGEIIKNIWLSIPDYFGNVVLDQFVIMPNHFHAIIGFEGKPYSKTTNKETSLSQIIQSFKTITYKNIKEYILNNGTSGEVVLSVTEDLIKTYNSIYQKSFYDHIIRNPKDLKQIQEYILNNPTTWEEDEMNVRT